MTDARRSSSPLASPTRKPIIIMIIVGLIVVGLVIWLGLRSTTSTAHETTPAIVAPTATVTETVKSDDPQPAFPAMFGNGFWLVGEQIAPVQYVNTDTTNPECFWARVDNPTFPHPHIVQFSEHKAGRFKIVIQPTDKVFYTRDCGIWKHLD